MNDPLPRPRLTLVVLLFVDPEHVDDFEEFERRAATIMARYGGRIERRMVLETDEGSPRPHEIHVVTFPDEEAFDGYGADPETRAMAALRERVIRRTAIWPTSGVEPPFG